MEGVFASHTRRNYGDIGYHFVIDYAGTVWEGRSLAYEGAHVACQNERNIGVMLLGNFEEQAPSASQIATASRLLGLLQQRFRIKPHRIFGHRDLGQHAVELEGASHILNGDSKMLESPDSRSEASRPR